MTLCKHEPHTTVDWVREPKYSTQEILLHKGKIDAANEHLLVKFTDCPSIPEWFYMSRTVVRRHRTQKNGNAEVYVVPLSKREVFEPLKRCEHVD